MPMPAAISGRIVRLIVAILRRTGPTLDSRSINFPISIPSPMKLPIKPAARTITTSPFLFRYLPVLFCILPFLLPSLSFLPYPSSYHAAYFIRHKFSEQHNNNNHQNDGTGFLIFKQLQISLDENADPACPDHAKNGGSPDIYLKRKQSPVYP